MDFIISQYEDELIKQNKVLFTKIDSENLIEYENSFINFLGLIQSGYKAKLALGQAKGNENKIYNYVECLEDIKLQIKNIGKVLQEHQKQQEKDKK